MTECRRRPSGVDVAITVLLTAFVLVGTAGAASSQDDALREMDALGFVLAVLSALPFAARRVAPIAAALVSASAVAAYFAAGYAFGPVLIALGLITASMAASMPLARSLPPGVVLLGIITTGLVIRFGRDADESGFVGLLVGPTWLAVPYAIGVVVGMRHEVRIRSRREEADRAVHSERLRIAAEVHDVAGHGLAVIAMQAGVALHVLDRKPEQARIALEEIRAASTEALDGLRATLDSLRTADADSAPLTPGLPGLADVPALVDRIRRAGLAVEVEMTGDAAAVPAAVGHSAYRVVQEALTNVLRHADATRAWVRVASLGEVVVSVRDDGAAVPGPEGSGITGMRARVDALGGTFRAGPAASGGYEVEAVFVPNRLWPAAADAQGGA